MKKILIYTLILFSSSLYGQSFKAKNGWHKFQKVKIVDSSFFALPVIIGTNSGWRSDGTNEYIYLNDTAYYASDLTGIDLTGQVNTALLWNNSGVFGSNSNLTYTGNKTLNALKVNSGQVSLDTLTFTATEYIHDNGAGVLRIRAASTVDFFNGITLQSGNLNFSNTSTNLSRSSDSLLVNQGSGSFTKFVDNFGVVTDNVLAANSLKISTSGVFTDGTNEYITLNDSVDVYAKHFLTTDLSGLLNTGVLFNNGGSIGTTSGFTFTSGLILTAPIVTGTTTITSPSIVSTGVSSAEDSIGVLLIGGFSGFKSDGGNVYLQMNDSNKLYANDLQPKTYINDSTLTLYSSDGDYFEVKTGTDGKYLDGYIDGTNVGYDGTGFYAYNTGLFNIRAGDNYEININGITGLITLESGIPKTKRVRLINTDATDQGIYIELDTVQNGKLTVHSNATDIITAIEDSTDINNKLHVNSLFIDGLTNNAILRSSGGNIIGDATMTNDGNTILMGTDGNNFFRISNDSIINYLSKTLNNNWYVQNADSFYLQHQDAGGQTTNLSIKNSNGVLNHYGDSAKFIGKLTSKYFSTKNYVNGAGVTVAISVANTYYTIKGMTNKFNYNMSYTDSTITVSETGLYDLDFYSSCNAAGPNRRVHFSCFVDNVEDTSFEIETKLIVAGDNYSSAFLGKIYLNSGQVVKIKTKYLTNTGTLTIDHLGFTLTRVN